MRIFALALIALALAGCIAGNRLLPVDGGLDALEAPEGIAALNEAADPMLFGERLMSEGRHDLALRAFTRAAATNGLTARTLTAIGSANLELGRLGQAEDQLRQALELDDRFLPAWNNLGVVLMEQGEFGEARRSFETAFALDSGRSDSIRENLLRAIARMDAAVYDPRNDRESPGLIRQSDGVFVLVPER